MQAIFSKKNLNNNYSQGFTLIEIVLIIFLVSFVFTGIYTLLAKTSQHEKDNRYSIIASNLAQEGAEIIRNRRDENLLKGSSMNEDLTLGICFPYWDGSLARCDGSKSSQVGLDGDDIYRNDGPTPTIFERSCNINGTNEILEVECTVSWESPSLGIEKSVTVESYLTNWQENI